MKAFWIALLALVMIGVGVVVMRRGESVRAGAVGEPLAARVTAADGSAAATSGTPIASTAAPDTGVSRSSPAALPSPRTESTSPESAKPKADAPSALAASSDAPKPDMAKVAAPPAEATKTQASKSDAAKVDATSTAPAAGAQTPAPIAQPAPAAPTKPTAKTFDDDSLPKLPNYEEFQKAMAEQDAASKEADKSRRSDTTPQELGVKVESRPDGSMLVEGTYVVKGDGTKEKPYVVGWDHVLSAQDSYVPKEGKKEIPGRIKMLDGKWVKVTGHIAFPLMAQSADELLAMMNQWDGCCIGVPPTPYDAVEVRLMSPVSGKARLTTYGSVTGRFKVDPHLVGGWLVGLYVMDQATLTPEGYGGFSP